MTNFQEGLFNFSFLVDHVLAYHGIVFFDLQLFRHRALILGRGVEMACAGA
jgi:hypothetical protein